MGLILVFTQRRSVMICVNDALIVVRRYTARLELQMTINLAGTVKP